MPESQSTTFERYIKVNAADWGDNKTDLFVIMDYHRAAQCGCPWRCRQHPFCHESEILCSHYEATRLTHRLLADSNDGEIFADRYGFYHYRRCIDSDTITLIQQSIDSDNACYIGRDYIDLDQLDPRVVEDFKKLQPTYQSLSIHYRFRAASLTLLHKATCDCDPRTSAYL